MQHILNDCIIWDLLRCLKSGILKKIQLRDFKTDYPLIIHKSDSFIQNERKSFSKFISNKNNFDFITPQLFSSKL